MTRTEFTAQVATIQANLNAPKGQYNSFGGYHYRSAEDILNAVKPLLGGLFLSISDDIIQLGDRFYVKATATITDGEHVHTASAMAREPLTKKGMDDSQITGTASSYARKYALNGLFGIDDAKDADTDAHAHQTGQQPRNNRQQQGGQRQQQQRPQNQQQRPQNPQRGQQNGGNNQKPFNKQVFFNHLNSELLKAQNKSEAKTVCDKARNALSSKGLSPEDLHRYQTQVHQAFLDRCAAAANQTQQAA
ncbi:ERF family protein [Klebsiella variicola subsp. variicola]|uniref:ERF family protein n=1 Tax=Klebsiella variicola TaxID=244366 RepID=UPI001E55EE55|nr:ERF family protein [Klebsiella variicola]MCD9775837.1 ERF family protein [Klebsiella variicola subsp. variicola]